MNRRDFIKVAVAGFGTVLAPNCKTRTEILQTTYPQAAYELGYKLKKRLTDCYNRKLK